MVLDTVKLNKHMLGWYRKHILPKLIDSAMSPKDFHATRQAIVAQASGVVLEIGAGSLHNLPFYSSNITKLYVLEPSKELFTIGLKRCKEREFQVAHLCVGAESISLPNESVDSIVSTWTLCSVNDPNKALAEIGRVLRPGGKIFFVEHGMSPHNPIRIMQNMVTHGTAWLRGNCHLDRDMEQLFKNNGFVFESLEKAPEDRLLMYSYRGVAKVKK